MKTIRLLLILSFVMTCYTGGQAQTSGTCEENLTWTFNSSTGTLTISGTGVMTNFDSYYFRTPWDEYRSQITQVEIGNGVTSIGNYAFDNCSGLLSVTIPEDLMSIGDYAFLDCSNLTSITLPNSVTSIGMGAFFGCSSLASITLSNSVTSIEHNTFHSCTSLTSITIPNSVKSIGWSVFSNCSNLASITFPSSMMSIGGHTFSECSSLRSITIPDGVTTIYAFTFFGCYNLTSITIPSSVTGIGGCAFMDCGSLRSIIIPGGVISDMAFFGCSSLSSVSILEGVSSIESDAFACCDLTSITIPSSVKSIGNRAFMFCRLTSVTCKAQEPPTLGFLVFGGVIGGEIGANIGIGTLYVPIGTRELYVAASGWSDSFDTITEELQRLTVNITGSININSYKNLSLELSKDDTVLSSFTTGNSDKYVFNVEEGVYKVTLKNKYGAVLGEINDIEITDKDVSVTFSSLAPLYTASLNIAGDGIQNLSGKPAIKWYDENNVFLQQGDSIAGLTAGMKLKYRIELNEDWGKVFVSPPLADYTVTSGNNRIPVTLQKISETNIFGTVKAENGSALSDALVTISQLLNGKYSKITTTKTDREGKFSASVFNDSTVITISYPDYFSQTLARRNFTGGNDLGVIVLSPISGVRIALNLTYTKSVAAGETPVQENWYSDYLNVDYELYNHTKGKAISGFVLQYPEIIITETVSIGDELLITARSRTNNFDPVQSSASIDGELRTTVQINIMQRGYIRATIAGSANAENTGILYDSEGKLIKSYDYRNSVLETNDLPAGSYTLVSMAKSRFFNAVLNLSALPATGLKQNVDYVQQNLSVKKGEITQANVPAIPALDESKLYYTGEKTLFSVNKTSITAGNYLTLRAEIDFKAAYTGKISNLKLIADIPEQCSFVENSIVVGIGLTGGYSIDNNRLTIPLANYSDIVRFCIIPLQGGNYAPNAFIQFDIDSKTIMQPIGAAAFTVENLSISVPEVTARKEITVRGAATAKSEIKVYDGDVLIGQTQALATGDWSVQCELYKPYAFSYHNIHAEVITPQGLNLQTETKQVTHNVTAIEVSKVTMINTSWYGEEKTVFDFLNPSQKKLSYNFYTNTNFTFKIEFTNNDPNLISDVMLNVLTTAKNTETLPAVYDPVKQLWVATGKFDAYRLPVNVSVGFEAKTSYYEIIDSESENIVLKAGNEEKKFKTTVADIMRQFEQQYKQYEKCAGMEKMLVDQYYADAKRSYRIHNFVISIPLIGFLSSATSIESLVLSSVIDAVMSSNFPGMDETSRNFITGILNNLNAALPYMEGTCVPSPPNPPIPPLPPATPIMDPSGYVYEAVPSNRLSDVTCTIYFKTIEENMYGEPEEKIVMWDAEEYAQENPMLTNKYGEYGWEVPAGVWHVKYEKDGYTTVYSDWLPVPPPQLDVNMAKVQPVQPTVEKAQGYETGINIEFDKFMQPVLMTTKYISVKKNGSSASGTISLLNEEGGAGGSFVSKVRFVPDVPFKTTDEVILTVKREVKSYADIEMAEDFVQRIAIQKEITAIDVPPVLELALNDKEFITVSVEPQAAASGKKITARSVSSSIAAVTSSAVLNVQGKATLQISGELPGSTVIYISVDDTDVKAEVAVHVAMPAPMERVATPTASIPSGSTVDKNTTVTLSSATNGAKIYYTLNGATPSVATGLEYTQAIVIINNVMIKAMAVKEGMLNSEIAVFEYLVDGSGIAQTETPTIIAYTQNQTLYIKGLKAGEHYAVYNVIGAVVAKGVAAGGTETKVALPGRGLYIVSTQEYRTKVLVK